jgi:hypothetical protein
MWAVIPPLTSQPLVDLRPDQPSRVIQCGWPSDYGQVLGQYRVNAYPYIGQAVTLTSAVPNIHAAHLMARVDPYTDLSICLGARYRLTLKSYVNSDPVHPFVNAGARYMRATIEDSGSTVATANLPCIPYPNRFIYPNGSGVVACFGYAFDGPTLKAYAHVSSHRVNASQQGQNGLVPSCGSGTASMIVNVNADDALVGQMSLIVREPTEVEPGDQTGWGGVEFFHMSCRIGPLLSVSPHMQERSADKLPLAGTRVASLRSKATNFSQPMATGGNGSSGVANCDCGGHAEFSQSNRFAISLAGQPDADTAYVTAGGSARGNCGFTGEHLTKLSSVAVTASNVNLVPDGRVIWFFQANTSFTKTIASDSYGNNEYTGVANVPGEGAGREWDSVHVQVRITGEETVDNFSATPIESVVARFKCTVLVTMFAAKNGEKVMWDSRPLSSSASKTLTEAEAVDFFNGEAISLTAQYGEAITVTASG